MHTTLVINYKDGVGKTTIIANLATELARRGQRVLLIDLDPQMDLTLLFVTPEDWQKKYSDTKTISRWFRSLEDYQPPLKLSKMIISPPVVNDKLKELESTGCVDLITSHIDLMSIDVELAQGLRGISSKQSAKNYLRIHGMLLEELKQIKDYDVVLIDCPHYFTMLSSIALVASNYLLIPTKANYISTLGVSYLIKSVRSFISNYNDYAIRDTEHLTREISPITLGVIFNMVKVFRDKPIETQCEYINKVIKLKIPVFDTYIEKHDKFFIRDGYGKDFDTLSALSYEDTSAIIAEFANEFEQKIAQLNK